MLEEAYNKLANAGLDLSVGRTRLVGGAALVANNVLVDPEATVTKRPGFQRAQELEMVSSIVARFEFSDIFLSVDSMGNIDASSQ